MRISDWSSDVCSSDLAVAEKFAEATGSKTPKIDSTGTGGGFERFCQGVGPDTPDISNASRRMKKSEFDKCQANGVKDIIEIQIGYDGLAFGQSTKGPEQIGRAHVITPVHNAPIVVRP